MNRNEVALTILPTIIAVLCKSEADMDAEALAQDAFAIADAMMAEAEAGRLAGK